MKGGALALVGLAGLVAATQAQIDRRLGGLRAHSALLYLWSGDQVRMMAPGLESLAADIYWLRVVQYFGGQRAYAKEKRFDLLKPLIDITTTLDPRLEIAYRYGAIFLSEAVPTGAGRPEEGVAVMERGCRANPRSWRLHQDLGFFYFVYLKDAAKAAEVLTNARRIPGAPYWLEAMAAQLLGQSGDRATARRMWQAMYDQSEEGPIRANAETNLRVIDAADGADRIQGLVVRFAEANGRRPLSLAELQQAGILHGSAKDPSGTPYDYDATTGKVNVSRLSSLYRP